LIEANVLPLSQTANVNDIHVWFTRNVDDYVMA